MGYRRLTPDEIEALRVEMRESGEWCRAELKRRRAAREANGHDSGRSVHAPASPETSQGSESS